MVDLDSAATTISRMVRTRWRRDPPVELINTSRVQAIADQVISSEIVDFVPLKRGVYARRIGADITQVLKLQSWKGAEYSFSWGVSLPYVPSKLSLPLRFHRTLNSTRLDLWEDHFSLPQSFSDCAYATGLHGETTARSELMAAWQWSWPLATTWWARAGTLDGILEIAVSQVADERNGEASHYPSPHLIAALTAARLGQLSDSRRHFDVATERLDDIERQAAQAALNRLLPAT